MSGRRWQRYQRFWLDFAVPRAKLAWFRAVFFTLIGIDAFLQISHAPRYGAGDFNVAHIPGLDALLPGPSRPAMLVVFLLQSYLGFRIACGAASRMALWLLTALYGYAYFISQLDSYQHHYFVFLVLLLCALVPWHEARTDEARGTPRKPGKPGNPRAGRVESWALRLIFAQVAILYLWAGVAKMAPAWLDGTTLSAQLKPGFVRDVVQWFGVDLAADLLMLTELFLAVALLVRKLWLPALVVGVGLHAGIELADFKIGIFSYFMFAFYVLLLPDRVVLRGDAIVHNLATRVRALMRAAASSAAAFWGAAAAMLALGTALVVSLPFRESAVAAAAMAGIAVVSVGRVLLRGRASGDSRARAASLAAIHLVACAAVLVMHAETDQAHDYYKYWGGTSRRLGVWDEAEIAYRTLTRMSPDYASGHYHLGNIARREGDIDEALASYERAQRANPEDYRAFLQAAEIHHHAGRGAEVLAAVTRVLELEPRNRRALARARALYQHWSGADPAPQ